jgi:DNA integrity scanning protein DisA with diadenylate cyclase activity
MMETTISTKQYGGEIILPNRTSEAGAKTYAPPGISDRNSLDTILVVDIDHEIQSVFAHQNDILPKNVSPEVFGRLLTIAIEFAMERLERNAIGCLFVLGSIEEIKPYTQPLILKPFLDIKKKIKIS